MFRANKWDPNGLEPESRACMDHYVPTSQGSSYDSNPTVSYSLPSLQGYFGGSSGDTDSMSFKKSTRIRKEVTMGSIARIIEQDDNQCQELDNEQEILP